MQPETPVNILLVDDRQENIQALEAILSPLGHTIVQAQSGKEALKCLLNQDFAVILLDVQMPIMDGFETAELIRGRERSQDTPIIFLTAVNTSENHMYRGYAIGAVDYLLKPIVPEILISKVSVFIELYIKTAKIARQAAELEANVKELEHQIDARQRTEDALRQARDELEERVRERTANLQAANAALQVEVRERERAEQEREAMLVREQAARADAEAAVRLRDQFLSIASHELKTPLTALFGNIQLLQRRVDRGDGMDERGKRHLQVIAEQTTRLSRLIEALLDISRIQTGQLIIDTKEFDLSRLAQRVVQESQPTFEEHSLQVIDASGPLLIRGDELRLEQVIQNLIQNAVKYSPSGGQISIWTGEREHHACVAVSDQGIGIPPNAIPHVFDRFYRADNVSTQHIGGMGIGLYVVREIVNLHGGRVSVTSEEGVGSTFTVHFPIVTN